MELQECHYVLKLVELRECNFHLNTFSVQDRHSVWVFYDQEMEEGGLPVLPTELVQHILSCLADPTDWLRGSAGVCRLWRALSHDLLRHHATSLLSALPASDATSCACPSPSLSPRQLPNS
jgi:hypothetical protein